MLISNEVQKNHLLRALPEDVQDRLFPYLERAVLSARQVLYEAGKARRYLYFPVDSIVSLLNVTESGSAAEIAKVGNEGVVGIASFLGSECSPWRAVIQSAGYAYRLSGQRMHEECSRNSDTLVLMLRYTQARSAQMAQTATCNRHHSIDQQLCRWLLLSLDRLPSNHMTMTQEFIANTLGVRREGVTDAAGKLQKRGVIEYRRGNIRILDRAELERTSCECYAVVKKETDRLLPSIPMRQTHSHSGNWRNAVRDVEAARLTA